jgi:hypothetical protein
MHTGMVSWSCNEGCCMKSGACIRRGAFPGPYSCRAEHIWTYSGIVSWSLSSCRPWLACSTPRHCAARCAASLEHANMSMPCGSCAQAHHVSSCKCARQKDGQACYALIRVPLGVKPLTELYCGPQLGKDSAVAVGSGQSARPRRALLGEPHICSFSAGMCHTQSESCEC